MAIVGYPVVECRWLVVPQVLEAGHVRVTNHERQVGVAIIHGTKLLTLEVSLHVVLHDWSLCMSGMLRSGGLTVNAITESENVTKSLVL